ncbi:MAG TPA: hypothetical protein VKB18_02750, partial [Gemmatimonadota bacterium]|nr:hypothetical protein [Gemmatimonadota bacterium]
MDGNLTADPRSAGAARVTEEIRAAEEGPELLVHAAWERDHAGLACGITTAGPGADFGLTTARDPWTLFERVEGLCAAVG